jgi:membrane protease YdiL (CAAX protease family)
LRPDPAGHYVAEATIFPLDLVLASRSLVPQGAWQRLAALACFMVAGSLIYGQCLVEEVSWRGYFLVRAMGCCGPWRGLLLHGLVWGFWYAPVLLLAGGGLQGSWKRAAEFAVTCVLLGILLGWLRLASRSVVPAVVANAVFTLGAGLPILLGGTDLGARGAIYSPVGWLPLALIAGWLALTRHREDVKMPLSPRPRGPRPSLALH